MAKKQDWPYDPRLRELVLAFLRMVKAVKKPYAVGGALAMGAHGYVRHTNDLDAFLLAEDRLEWMRAARAVGLTVDRVFGDIHIIAFFLKHGDPRIRIDMLFPFGNPELSAVAGATPGKIGGINASVFPVELLAIAKFMSDRPEDQRDFDTMFNLGLFEPDTVRALLAVTDPDEVAPFEAKIRALVTPKPHTRIGRRGRK